MRVILFSALTALVLVGCGRKYSRESNPASPRSITPGKINTTENAKQCEGEAQFDSAQILSTKYIPDVGCWAEVAHFINTQSNVFCKVTLFDVDMEAEGLIVSPPSDDECTVNAGEKLPGAVAERHGKYIYLYNPEKVGVN